MSLPAGLRSAPCVQSAVRAPRRPDLRRRSHNYVLRRVSRVPGPLLGRQAAHATGHQDVRIRARPLRPPLVGHHPCGRILAQDRHLSAAPCAQRNQLRASHQHEAADGGATRGVEEEGSGAERDGREEQEDEAKSLGENLDLILMTKTFCGSTLV